MHLLCTVNSKQKKKRKIFSWNLKATDEKSRIRRPMYGSKDPDPSQNVMDPEYCIFSKAQREKFGWDQNIGTLAWRSKDPDLLKKLKSVDPIRYLFFVYYAYLIPLCLGSGSGSYFFNFLSDPT
jgi:hypothetical protein